VEEKGKASPKKEVELVVFKEGRMLKRLNLARNIAKENNQYVTKGEDSVISAFAITQGLTRDPW